ncbi:hypothetical protein QVD17_18879 [Tagetes erecta]|uniref:Uncharacterized protein n=1 Tax=Tagetes erecta TaxID=13708 RepID=A0AAD8KIH4_TARER|nr:hypothetical protein QVD17_18879 [Tagetes erecta]
MGTDHVLATIRKNRQIKSCRRKVKNPTQQHPHTTQHNTNQTQPSQSITTPFISFLILFSFPSVNST